MPDPAAIRCAACGDESPPGARFCMHCAAPLIRSCAACGGDLPAGARFCPGCAHPTDAPATPQAAPERPAPRAYTPRHLAEKVLRSRAALEGERKQVTVLFADVSGSLALAEQVGPEEWHRLLDGFFQVLSEGVHRYEGTVNQYTGDGIMALFGAPIAHEDHAQRACYAALHLRQSLRRYADELRRTRGLSFSVRIGLNSGAVVVGRIGDDLRMDYTAQGLTVGLAQRMEQLAAPDSAYLTAHTARLVEGFFSLRDLGEFDLKGVTEPLGVYELEDAGALRTRLQLSRARGFSRFVGRSDELAQLDLAYERARQGQGGTVGVVADAGVGKSRLCLEFVERCRARDIAVFQAHCPAHGRLIPLLPVLELLRDVFGIGEDDPPQAVREKVAGRLLLLDRELEAELPLVFDLLGVPDPARPLAIQDPGERQRALLAFVRRLVRARSAREPAVLLLDDVHWIDPGSEEFLASLVDLVSGTRTLLLLNFRPEYRAEWMAQPSYQRLPLLPLGDEAIDDLLDHLLGPDPSTVPLRAVIRERTAGNPFFIEEVVQSLRESGGLVGERGELQLVATTARLEVPESVQAILSARIDRLPEREKQVLQTAAAIGRRFGESLLRSVCELPGEALDEALAALRLAELVHEESIYPDVEYAFRHPLTHEVAQASQLADSRARVHARIAQAIEELRAERLDDHAALLAHHWDEAREPAPAARWHRRAAEHIAGGNPPEARRHWSRVRDLAPALDDPAAARELGERARLMILEYGWRTGISPEEANALLAEGERWAREQGDSRALAALYNAVAMPFAFSFGDPRRAARIAEQGLSLAEQAGDKVLAFALELRVFFAGEGVASTREMQAVIERASRYPREVMEQASALVGYDAWAMTVGCLGWPLLNVGRAREAIPHLRRGIELARERDASEVVGWLSGIEGEALALLGESAAALERFQQASEIAERIDSNLSRVLACNILAGLLTSFGDFGSAAELLESRREAAATSCKHLEPELLARLAEARCGQGRVEEARALADRALALAEERGLVRGRIEAGLAAVRVALCETRPESLRAAWEQLASSERHVREFSRECALPRLLELRAEVADARGDAAARRAALVAARDAHRSMSADRHAARVEALLAG